MSLIVEQLARERWVVEGGVAHLPRGRKPRLLSLDIERAGIIGVNIRPRATTVALSDLNGSFDFQESFPTPREPQGLIKALAAMIERLVEVHSGKTFEGIGISVPGRVDRTTAKLVFAPNLGWRDVDLKGPLERATKIPVLVENAANACALAETWSGPFAGVQDLIAVTVSEGIGTGIIANGRLVRGPGGAAGEFGHVCIDPSGPPCNCGSHGCWEVYASNAAAVRAYNEDPPSRSASTRYRKSHAQASVEDFKDLLSLADRGDVRACQVLERMGRYLGYGLAILINGLAPSVITIVGEVTRAWDKIGPVVQTVVEERSKTHSATRIVPTDEVMQPRLRGTVALVLQKHFQPSMFP
ncbi:MAG TPA: ROK family protein [Verrucomicrobiae bacterium]|nr:ROK family protein [Verrucomicrobiae bacterium]HZT68420.1 ROK family protein [Terriglobia bacterium]